MPQLLEAVVTGSIAFAATNIDDIFVLTLFFAQKTSRRWRVVVGQYLGFAALVAISLVGYFAHFIAPREWVGLLGIAPMIIGVKKLIEWKRAGGENNSSHGKPVGVSVFSVAAVTFANGGDNIGVYTPLFARGEAAQLGVTLAVFFALTAVWCAVGYYLGSHHSVGRALDRYGHVIVPFVLIGLGVYIMYESGAFRLAVNGSGLSEA